MGDKKHRRRGRKGRKGGWLRRSGYAAAALLLVTVGAALLAHRPRPSGSAGPAADALARRVEAAINRPGWEATGAIRWNFGGRHQHLWDRKRRLHRVRWSDIEVVRSFDTGQGRAYQGGQEVTGARRETLLSDAYAKWANDSFWLNPLVKLFDDGVTRELVETDGGTPELLVRYASGGVTPGDAYLWTLAPDGTPTRWRMWVRIIPMGGVETSWERWVTLPTGARVASYHAFPIGGLELTDIEAAATLAELEGETDPFAALVVP